MINHQTAMNGLTADDSKWQISVSLSPSLPLPLCSTVSIIVIIAQCQRQHPCFMYTIRWSSTGRERGLVCHQLGMCNHVPVMRSQGCACCISITTERKGVVVELHRKFRLISGWKLGIRWIQLLSYSTSPLSTQICRVVSGVTLK